MNQMDAVSNNRLPKRPSKTRGTKKKHRHYLIEYASQHEACRRPRARKRGLFPVRALASEAEKVRMSGEEEMEFGELIFGVDEEEGHEDESQEEEEEEVFHGRSARGEVHHRSVSALTAGVRRMCSDVPGSLSGEVCAG